MISYPLLHNEALVDAQNHQKSRHFYGLGLKGPLAPVCWAGAKGSCPTATDRCCRGRDPLAPAGAMGRGKPFSTGS